MQGGHVHSVTCCAGKALEEFMLVYVSKRSFWLLYRRWHVGIHRSQTRDGILLHMPRLGTGVAWTRVIVEDMARYR